LTTQDHRIAPLPAGPAGRLSSGTVGAGDRRGLDRWRTANLALAVAAGLLAIGFVWQIASPAGPALEPLQPGLPSSVPMIADDDAAGGTAGFTVPAGRRLFVETAPPPVAGSLADAIAAAKGRLELKAIVPVGGRMAAYFVVLPASGAAVRARPAPLVPGRRPAAPPPRPSGRGGMASYFEGDRVGDTDFTVKKVEPRSVILTMAGQDVTFSL
jgi:hypothetical protein